MGNKRAKRQAAEQAKLADTITKHMQQQFAQQQEVLKFLNQQIQGILQRPGFSETTRAALRTNLLESSAARFEQAQRQLQARSFIQGGRQLPSGVQAQLEAALAGERAAAEASGLRDIALAEEQARAENERFALGLAAGPLLQGTLAVPGSVGAALEARQLAFQSAKATGGGFFSKLGSALLGGISLASPLKLGPFTFGLGPR